MVGQRHSATEEAAVNSFWTLDYLCLAAILGGAFLVLRLRNLAGATMALSAVGLGLSLLFVVLGAPDDAHSEIVVGAVALPVLYLVAIGKSRTDVRSDAELSEADHQRQSET